ncbi:MAG: hypothetical protein ACOYJ1_13775 [Peptococcales bacterium]|jgi:hypothetical protein
MQEIRGEIAMTDTQTEQLTGRALDAAVAERVMGLKIADHNWPCGRDPESGTYVAAPSLEEARELSWLYYERGPIQVCPRGCREPVPFYSRDIAEAWPVHQRMLDTQPGEYAFAFQRLAGLWDLWGRTLQALKAITPELICRAALAAAGGRADG